MQNTYLNGVDIKVEPFDLSYTGELYKLDLLFYNNVNRHGEILSSLVYNSGRRNASDKTLIVYNPNKLFLNTSTEASYVITGTSNLWKNMTILTTGLTNLRDNSAGANNTLYPKFNEGTSYAVPYQNGEHAYDGWYTLYSVALHNYDDTGSGVTVGTLRINNAGTVQYCSATNVWSNLTAITSTIRIYNFVTDVLRPEVYQSYDFVSTVKINSLNNILLDNKLDSGCFKIINILNPKLCTLESAIEFKEFDKAQHMINSISNSLLSLLI